MSTTRHNQIVETVAARRLSAIIRTKDESLARDAMGAAAAGGFPLAELARPPT